MHIQRKHTRRLVLGFTAAIACALAITATSANADVSYNYCDTTLSPGSYCDSGTHTNLVQGKMTATNGGKISMKANRTDGSTLEPYAVVGYGEGYQCYGTSPLSAAYSRTKNGDGTTVSHYYDGTLWWDQQFAPCPCGSCS